MNVSRRNLVRAAAMAMACASLRSVSAQVSGNGTTDGNFRYIYTDPISRSEFRNFLVNVFRLYPEDELHTLIEDAVRNGGTDEDIYRAVQPRLDEIKTLFGDITYSLPTLNKQKEVLAEQTTALTGKDRRFEGYLEIGSNGRFLDSLEEELDIVGETFTISEQAPSFSLVDILDRGQLPRVGEFIALNDYRPGIANRIPARSIDLVTVFIGFHHCPVSLRDEFITDIRDSLRPGGMLVVRDHNVHDERMWRMVALAHDVFNMGTHESWSYNARERRHFYSLDTLHGMLTRLGFRTDGRRILQDGDPTQNTLMLYTKA